MILKAANTANLDDPDVIQLLPWNAPAECRQNKQGVAPIGSHANFYTLSGFTLTLKNLLYSVRFRNPRDESFLRSRIRHNHRLCRNNCHYL